MVSIVSRWVRRLKNEAMDSTGRRQLFYVFDGGGNGRRHMIMMIVMTAPQSGRVGKRFGELLALGSHGLGGV